MGLNKSFFTTLISHITLALGLAVMFFLLPHSGHGQERCATVEAEKLRSQQVPGLPTEQEFEDWIDRKMREKRVLSEILRPSQTHEPVVTIPVVVHVIHNGTNHQSNISDAQIMSQIAVLNEDFRRLNADAVATPAEFQPVASDIEIEFVLARQSPEGLPTSGINRVLSPKTTWSVMDNFELKSLSYWPAEDYLNIWVTTLGNEVLGYAQFPVSALEGMEAASTNRLTDGVVVDYRAFGSKEKGAFPHIDNNYNKGRTCTHEVGHFLGLRHIWGDGNNCTATDYVADTPNQFEATNGCPGAKFSCNSNDMFQNYMDYSFDGCMNLFTAGQKARMRTVLDNSPRRTSLINSPGALVPGTFANDLGVASILSPNLTQCEGDITPTIRLVNTGNNPVTSAQILYRINGVQQEIRSLTTNLAPGQFQDIAFAPIALETGNYQFTFLITTVNGGTDGFPSNNFKEATLFLYPAAELPFSETFTNFPPSWKRTTYAEDLTWTITNTQREGSINPSVFLNFYDYEVKGEVALLTTPRINLSQAPIALLRFDVAYVPYPGFADGLKIFVLDNCSPNPFSGTLVYEKFGTTLATGSASAQPFTPTTNAQWRTETIDLSAFAGQENIQIAFMGVNDWGNNLYLDNVVLITDESMDISLTEIRRPGLLSCVTRPNPEIIVKNTGSQTVNSFSARWTLNGAPPITGSLSNLELLPGSEIAVQFPSLNPGLGQHTLTIEIFNPNGEPEPNTTNNTKSLTFRIDANREEVPLRQNFSKGMELWRVVNPDQGETWEVVSLAYTEAIQLDAANYLARGQEDWLVSPSLDFSKVRRASLFFDRAYATSLNGSEQLEVRVSTDCGETYPYTIYQKSGTQLNTASPPSPGWIPGSTADWQREYLSLSQFDGEANLRIAFVATNDNGNKLLLDNIELYLDDRAQPVVLDNSFFAIYPNPNRGRFQLVFTLPERETVDILITDTAGRIVSDLRSVRTLNQHYSLDLSAHPDGIYLVRVSGQSFAGVHRMVIIR